MGDGSYDLSQIGVVRSALVDSSEAPKQGREGAPPARVVIDPAYADALDGIEVGDRLLLVTWLDRADRSVLRVHPRDDESNPMRGVFSTRSQHRPNPIGLHPITVVSREGTTLDVDQLEALDGTPVVDLKVQL